MTRKSSSVPALHAAHRSVSSALAYAIAVTAIILSAKIFFEATPPGRWIEIGAFQFLQERLPNFTKQRLPVLVLDISKLPGGFDENGPTSRAALREIIQAVSDAGARAIGVDIDFSPGPAGWVNRREDPAFLDFCLSTHARTPLFLGVFRARNGGPERWLGLPKYQILAADLAGSLPEALNTTTRAERRLVIRRDEGALPSFGYALAKAYVGDQGLPGPPRWLRPFLIGESFVDEPGTDSEQKSEEAHEAQQGQLLNYSKLEQLQTERLTAIHALSISDAAADIAGKLVILGDDDVRRNGGDWFIPPGRSPTPGVLFHASAAYTFAIEPLFEFNHVTRNILDIVLALPFFAIVVLRAKHEKETTAGVAEADWGQIEKRALLVSIVVVLMLGLLFMFVMRVMWLDFILVIMALVAHPYLSDKAEKIGEAVKRCRSSRGPK